MRVAHVAPIRARCFNSKRTSFHVALELEHVESVDLRSAIRKADAVLPAFARAGQRGDTLKRVARRGGCRLLFRLGVQHIPWSSQNFILFSRGLTIVVLGFRTTQELHSPKRHVCPTLAWTTPPELTASLCSS